MEKVYSFNLGANTQYVYYCGDYSSSGLPQKKMRTIIRKNKI